MVGEKRVFGDANLMVAAPEESAFGQEEEEAEKENMAAPTGTNQNQRKNKMAVKRFMLHLNKSLRLI